MLQANPNQQFGNKIQIHCSRNSTTKFSGRNKIPNFNGRARAMMTHAGLMIISKGNFVMKQCQQLLNWIM